MAATTSVVLTTSNPAAKAPTTTVDAGVDATVTANVTAASTATLTEEPAGGISNCVLTNIASQLSALAEQLNVQSGEYTRRMTQVRTSLEHGKQNLAQYSAEMKQKCEEALAEQAAIILAHKKTIQDLTERNKSLTKNNELLGQKNHKLQDQLCQVSKYKDVIQTMLSVAVPLFQTPQALDIDVSASPRHIMSQIKLPALLSPLSNTPCNNPNSASPIVPEVSDTSDSDDSDDSDSDDDTDSEKEEGEITSYKSPQKLSSLPKDKVVFKHPQVLLTAKKRSSDGCGGGDRPVKKHRTTLTVETVSSLTTNSPMTHKPLVPTAHEVVPLASESAEEYKYTFFFRKYRYLMPAKLTPEDKLLLTQPFKYFGQIKDSDAKCASPSLLTAIFGPHMNFTQWTPCDFLTKINICKEQKDEVSVAVLYYLFTFTSIYTRHSSGCNYCALKGSKCNHLCMFCNKIHTKSTKCLTARVCCFCQNSHMINDCFNLHHKTNKH
ncbi:protein ORF83 [Lake sturgeon herpesvirus]|nr:protein ORF83 [Lake sturgeon herpesvirus]